ncbi:hypothetical protein MN116_001292 [Schistosoma mekongi]|uniref:Uncharacterized protein n=1 Tax=Schistosoma mekongi TaxID=38744 RepID=A0AAE2D987_SCHME|nr:hypothetical protein MN116_001292 [Schistosoma mekongi]
MTELDLYSEFVAEDDAQRFEYSCTLDVHEHVRFLRSRCSLLDAEVGALRAHVSRLEKERLILIATKDQVVDNFSRMGLACRREIEKLKSHIKILCAKYRIPEPKAVNKRNFDCDTQINPANQNYYTDLVAYLHSDRPPINVYSGNNVASTNFIPKCDAATQTEGVKKDDLRTSGSSLRLYSLSPSSSSMSSSSSSQEQSSSHIFLVNNECPHNFSEPAVDGRQLVSHPSPLVNVSRKNLENYKHRDSFTRVHEKSCELKQNSTLSDCCLVNKRLHRPNKKSRNKYALVDDANKQLSIIDGCSLKCTRAISGQSSYARCFHQEKRKGNRNNGVMNDPRKKTDTSEISILSSRKVEEFSSPLNIKKCSSVGCSTVKDFLMVQHVLHPLSRLTYSKTKESCTGPDSFSRNHVSKHLLIAVESAIRLSRDHHSVRRLHDAANSIHHNRYSKYCYRNYQTHDVKSHSKSCDYSREPERRTEEVGCTLYTKRLRFKGDNINMDVESTSGDLNDSFLRSIKENSQLTSKASSTLNTSIPNSPNTVSDIYVRDYSDQEIVHASSEKINSVNQLSQSSNYFFSRNDLFSSIKKNDGDLVLPEVLKITPSVSHYQECVEQKSDSPPIRKIPCRTENSFDLIRDNVSLPFYTGCHSHPRSNHSLTDPDHSKTFSGAEGNQEEGKVADQDDDDDAGVSNSSFCVGRTRIRYSPRSSHVSRKTSRVSPDSQVNESINVLISKDLGNVLPYPKSEQRIWRYSQLYAENDGYMNSSSGFVNLSLRASPRYGNHGPRYTSSFSRSPPPNYRIEHYNHHNPYRSSNSATKHHKRRELSNKGLASGQHDRSSVSVSQPRRRTHHSLKPPKDPDFPIHRSEHERASLHNRQSRVLTPVQNRNSYRRIGINPPKTSGRHSNSTHRQRL